MKLFNSKKAVSPIFATLLLVVFALILGVIVMAVGGESLSLDESKEIPSGINVLDIINSCKDKGAITAEEVSIIKENLK